MKSTSPLEPEVIDNRFSSTAKLADLSHLEALARLMDSVFVIPGLKLRFGLDAIIGLFPGLGDFASSFVTFYILQEAHRRGVSRLTLARMGFNTLVDWLIGSIPLVGDAFDVYWKSNQRNVALLIEHEGRKTDDRRRSTGDWLFLVGILLVLMAALVGSLSISFFLVSSLFRWLMPR